jgi:hypothetical protein
MRIQEAQNHSDPDPEHRYLLYIMTYGKLYITMTSRKSCCLMCQKKVESRSEMHTHNIHYTRLS